MERKCSSQVWKQFKGLAKERGVSAESALERVLVDAVAKKQIPGVWSAYALDPNCRIKTLSFEVN